MHTVERLEQALAAAEALGFVVRQDWFGGSASGACELKGRRWLLLDLALTPQEQLEQVLGAIQSVTKSSQPPSSHELQKMLKLRKAA